MYPDQLKIVAEAEPRARLVRSGAFQACSNVPEVTDITVNSAGNSVDQTRFPTSHLDYGSKWGSPLTGYIGRLRNASAYFTPMAMPRMDDAFDMNST